MATRLRCGAINDWIARLTVHLDARVSWRLLPLLTGFLFATGRRTVSSWLRAGDLSDDYQDYYYFLASLGHKVKSLAAVLLRIAAEVIAPQGRILLALDDTPSQRYGPKVEGAGVHHNPTPGPAGSKFLYGHNWVTLAWVVRHPRWGAIGLPLLARMYVRRKDLAAQCLTFLRRVTFQTKLVMAAELVQWAALWLRFLGRELWVVVDGAYAKRPFLKAALVAGAIVVSRLRKDAALLDVPVPPLPGQRGRGRPRTYGKNKLSLAKRAGQRRGWQRVTLALYGKEVTKRYKTFLATYRPAGGLIRVVLVEEESGDWRAYFCTKAGATVTEILEAVADRAAIEQVFHDVKEVHGVDQAQVRNYWSNVAVYHVQLWWHTLIELWAWHRPVKALVDRRLSPWAIRGPSGTYRVSAVAVVWPRRTSPLPAAPLIGRVPRRPLHLSAAPQVRRHRPPRYAGAWFRSGVHSCSRAATSKPSDGSSCMVCKIVASENCGLISLYTARHSANLSGCCAWLASGSA